MKGGFVSDDFDRPDGIRLSHYRLTPEKLLVDNGTVDKKQYWTGYIQRSFTQSEIKASTSRDIANREGSISKPVQ